MQYPAAKKRRILHPIILGMQPWSGTLEWHPDRVPLYCGPAYMLGCCWAVAGLLLGWAIYKGWPMFGAHPGSIEAAGVVDAITHAQNHEVLVKPPGECACGGVHGFIVRMYVFAVHTAEFLHL